MFAGDSNTIHLLCNILVTLHSAWPAVLRLYQYIDLEDNEIPFGDICFETALARDWFAYHT